MWKTVVIELCASLLVAIKEEIAAGIIVVVTREEYSTMSLI